MIHCFLLPPNTSLAAYTLRNAGACIHTHSQNAVLVTLLYDKEFRITHQEMIKGIRKGTTKTNLRYFDELVVPIIENTVPPLSLQRLCLC